MPPMLDRVLDRLAGRGEPGARSPGSLAMGRIWRRVALVLVGGLAAASLTAGAALADATPIELVLSYMPKVSNTGPQVASGIAELVMPEGEVRISATGLPHLDGDDEYVAWVLNTQTNDFLRLGAFNAAEATGTVHYEQVLPDAIPDKHWNLLLLTVEHGATPDTPSTRHSLAATFPRLGEDPPPAMLPNTGGAPDPTPPLASRRSDSAPSATPWSRWAPDWLPTLGLAALTGLLGLAAGYVTGKRA